MTDLSSFPSEAFNQEPLSVLISAGQPVFAVAAAGAADAGQVVWANPAGVAFLGGRTGSSLASLLSGASDPALRSLARLAGRMQQGAAPQLQKIRISRGGATGAIVTVRCWRIDGTTPLFVVAALDAPHALCMPGQQGPSENQALISSEPKRPEPEVAPVSPQQQSSPGEIAPRSGNVRFLWRCDAAGKLTKLDGALCEVMGCDTGALIGRTFDQLISELPLTPSEPLLSALLRRETWSRVEVMWPFSGQDKCAPVTLGGLPSVDRSGVFDGYTGFGVIHLDEVSDLTLSTQHDRQPGETVPDADSVGDMTLEDEELPAHSPEQTENSTPPFTPSVESDSTLPAATQPASNVVPLRSRQRDGQSAASPVSSPAQDQTPSGQQPVDPLDAIRQDMLAAADDMAASDAGSEGAEGPATKPGNDANVVQEKNERGAQDDVRGNISEDAGSIDATAGKPDIEGAKTASGLRFDVPKADPDGTIELSPAERNAFREIARALGARSGNRPDLPASEAEKSANKHGPLRPAAIAAAIAAGTTKGATGAPVSADNGLAIKVSGEGAHTEDSAAQRNKPADDVQRHEAGVAALLNRIGVDVLLLQDGKGVYANKSMLATLGYADFDAFLQGGGVERMFRGRDPEMLARDAAGGALPVITKSGDVITLDGKLQSASWLGKPATLLTLQENSSLELDAKLRAVELDVRRRESEVRELNAILDTATDGVVLLDVEGRILSLNGSAQALFGYDQNEVAGELLTILLARESHKSAMEYLSGLKSNGVRSVLNDGRDVTGRAHKGGTMPLFMTIGRIASSPEQRFCAVLRDITQWKKAERELSDARREAERTSSLKSDFLAKISHEVRTPLNAILGFAEVIIEERFGPVGNERYKDYLKDIHSSGTHVLSLINDLLDLSKIEAGKLELEFGSVDVSKVVNECVSIMQSQAIRERVIIRQSLAPRLPNVVADERSLRQIVLNILSNAVKFNEPGGQVIVSTALTDAGSAVIRIRDTGIGMSDQEVEMALEPFRQIATSRRSGGTGLGLPLTKALVEANRASFTIKSKREEGTLVEVAFPPTRVLAE